MDKGTLINMKDEVVINVNHFTTERFDTPTGITVGQNQLKEIGFTKVVIQVDNIDYFVDLISNIHNDTLDKKHCARDFFFLGKKDTFEFKNCIITEVRRESSIVKFTYDASFAVKESAKKSINRFIRIKKLDI